MKATAGVLFIVLLTTSLTLTRQSQGMGFLLPEAIDTVRVIKEYYTDNVVLSTSQQKVVNGCWKEFRYLQYDRKGNLVWERTTRYEKGQNNTCDFTPYIEFNRVYEKQKLYRAYSMQAACDACEATPCGVEQRWNASGKIIVQRNRSKCSFSQKPAK